MSALVNTKESPLGILAAEVERFERLCSEERSFGAEIERVIQQMDELAQEDITHAAAELEVCQMECTATRDRLQKAREGKGVTPNGTDAVSVSTQDRSRANATTVPTGPRTFLLVTLPTSSPLDPSPLSTPSDVDAFSVILDGDSIPEVPFIANLGHQPATQANTNPTSYLASIVERCISLCETRRSLEKEILNGLERRERLHQDAVESAKVSLVMMRRDAADIVTRLKNTSGGIINITIPWLQGGEIRTISPSSTPPSTALTPTPPGSVCPGQVASPPVPIIVAPKSPLATNSVAITPRSTTVVAHSAVSPPLIPVVLALEPTPSTSPPAFVSGPTPIANPPVPAKLPVIARPGSTVHVHQALFQRYERNMVGAKSTVGALKVSSIPWPVLNYRFPLDLMNPSLATAAFQVNLRDFINAYSQWKKLAFKKTSTAMLSDWVLISSKLKKKNKGGRNMADKVITHLRVFSK